MKRQIIISINEDNSLNLEIGEGLTRSETIGMLEYSKFLIFTESPQEDIVEEVIE